jgi:hypothetical protein
MKTAGLLDNGVSVVDYVDSQSASGAPFCGHVTRVVCVRPEEQMRRLIAGRGVAVVENEHPSRDRPEYLFVRLAVDIDEPHAVPPMAVASPRESARPEAAGRHAALRE